MLELLVPIKFILEVAIRLEAIISTEFVLSIGVKYTIDLARLALLINYSNFKKVQPAIYIYIRVYIVK